MLNKGGEGENVHDLRQHIRFVRQGQTHTSSRETHELTALCLALVMNCFTSWSARYQTAIIDRLEREDHPVSATARAHISAVRYAHVNQHGRYRFNRREPADGRLRRLRPANIHRLHGEVAGATQNRAERDGD